MSWTPERRKLLKIMNYTWPLVTAGFVVMCNTAFAPPSPEEWLRENGHAAALPTPQRSASTSTVAADELLIDDSSVLER
jgi:hypothetical protein